MRNKVRILGAFLLASLMLAPAGCSKENPGADTQKAEPSEKTVEDHEAEARKIIESKREKAKADCGTYLTARAGSGRVRYTDEKGPDKKRRYNGCGNARRLCRHGAALLQVHGKGIRRPYIRSREP